MIKISKIILFISLLVSCGEKEADLIKTNSYFKNGFSFEYPGNWSVSNEINIDTYNHVMLDTTADSLAIIELSETSEAQDFKEYANEFSKSTQGEMPIGKIITKGTKYTDNEIIENLSIELLGESIPHKRYYFKKIIGDKVCYITFQLPTEDESKVIKGYDLIKSSIKYKNP